MAALRTLHAWSGLVLCLLIAAIAFSGAVLTYAPAWHRATVPGATAAADLSPAALAKVMAAAEAEFGRDGVNSVTFASPRFGLHQVYAKGGQGGGYLDGEGRLVQRWGQRERASDWLFELHRGLLGGATGDKIVGWLGVALALMTVSGLVLWWPARRSFRARVTPGRGRAGWLNAHRDLGLMTAPFVIALALTGAALNLPDLSRPLMRAPLPPPPAAQTAEAIDWAVLLAAAQSRFPDAAVRMAVEPAPGRAASVRLRQPQEWHANGRTIVYLDPVDGRVLQVVDAQRQALGARVFNSFWPIHAARVGGWAWELAVFLSGVGLGLLALYGAEAYRRKLFRRRGSRGRAVAPA